MPDHPALTMPYKDHFSAHAALYAAARPDYPTALFSWLAGQCVQQQRAWDCATGNGQAAVGLAPWFDEVIASDASAEQVAHARPQGNVSFRCFPAEAPELAAASVDLITVAQALHWFAIDEFFSRLDPVLRPQGILAIWCYGQCQITSPIDAIVSHFYEQIVGPYWPPERTLVEEQYQSVAFPYSACAVPAFSMEKHWRCEQLCNYLASWSATRRYIKERGQDPVPALYEQLQPHWSQAVEKTVCWPLTVVVRRK